MLVDPPIEKLLPKVENRYTLALSVAKRARQLVDGAEPLVEEEKLDSPSLVSLAAAELAEDQIVVLPGLHEPVIPLRPEILQAQQRAREEEEEDGLEPSLRQDLEASEPAQEEPEEEVKPRSLIRELREDEFFELPTDLEREFQENFGDLDRAPTLTGEAYGDGSEIDAPEDVEQEVAHAEEADDEDIDVPVSSEEEDDELEDIDTDEDLNGIDSSIDDVVDEDDLDEEEL